MLLVMYAHDNVVFCNCNYRLLETQSKYHNLLLDIAISNSVQLQLKVQECLLHCAWESIRRLIRVEMKHVLNTFRVYFATIWVYFCTGSPDFYIILWSFRRYIDVPCLNGKRFQITALLKTGLAQLYSKLWNSSKGSLERYYFFKFHFVWCTFIKPYISARI